jgi:hypothetical protein
MAIEKKLQQYLVVWKDSSGETRKFSTYSENATVALNDALECVAELHNNPAIIEHVVQVSNY